MMYRDNTAYDFDLFAPKKEVVEIPDRQVKKKNQKAVSHNKSFLNSRLFMVSVVVALLLLVMAQLHCQLQNSEVVDQITRTEKSIETLQSENVRLQTELENKISFTNMEETAKEMGMQKITVAQTQYINLHKEDAAEVLGGKSALASVQDWF